ncbi:MAG: ABC transporter permease, partial [Caldisphaeraceae archaeon]|nr:ABC transporter permease [Caldisphaeraceae archaeon]
MKSKALIWKELLDLSRDKRTLAVMIIIPFIGLPAMALVTTGLSSTQTTTVYIEVLDNKSLYIAKFISSQVTELSRQYGLRVNVTLSNGPPKSI